jgi:hypothetical protein
MTFENTVRLRYNSLPGTEEKERYSRESAITGKNLPDSFLENLTTFGMLKLLVWMNQFCSFQLLIFRRLYFVRLVPLWKQIHFFF